MTNKVRDWWDWIGVAKATKAPIIRPAAQEQPTCGKVLRIGRINWVLSALDHQRGYVRPLRFTYTHLVCTGDTTMSSGSAELWARHPHRQPTTWCDHCRKDAEVDEFIWIGSTERVGS